MKMQNTAKETYDKLTDEQVIMRYHDGEIQAMEYLLEKYKNLVRKKASSRYLVGGDTEDLLQVGMIGLSNAVQHFDEKKESSFFHFAEICIERKINSEIERYNRKKHGPLNNSVSLQDEESAEAQHLRINGNNRQNPEEMMIADENVREFVTELMQSLSPLEQRVMWHCIMGESYNEIAQILGKTPKSIDNAIQRIRRKTAHLAR